GLLTRTAGHFREVSALATDIAQMVEDKIDHPNGEAGPSEQPDLSVVPAAAAAPVPLPASLRKN
ncbi:hypothetical protein ACFPVZ_01285, partial [Actinacidiphila bryophytorum]